MPTPKPQLPYDIHCTIVLAIQNRRDYATENIRECHKYNMLQSVTYWQEVIADCDKALAYISPEIALCVQADEVNQ